MDSLMNGNKYSESACHVRAEIQKAVSDLFTKCGHLNNEAVFSLLINAAIIHIANRKLLEDDPLSDDDEMAVDLTTKIINAVEAIINSSSLPTETIAAYGAKAIFGLANMR